MPKLPEPPTAEELRDRLEPDVAVLPSGTLLFRIYFVGTPHPPPSWNAFRGFGPVGTARFDHHPEPRGTHDGFGILYLAQEIKTCVAEAFQEGRAVDTRSGEPWLVAFRLSAEVRLLSLRGDWPTRAGASMAINSGPRPRCRRWSRAIYAAYAGLHGLLYASSMHANREAIALYERARHAVPRSPEANMPLSRPGLEPDLERFARELGYDFIPGPGSQSKDP
jgi:hypothetical protein